MDLLEKIKNALPVIEGWCSFEKAKVLVDIIQKTNAQLCVEIGVFGGSSLIPQAMALHEKKSGIIYGIDPWQAQASIEGMSSDSYQGQVNIEWWGRQLDYERIYQHCVGNIERYDLKNHCQLIRDKSENVVNNFQDNSIDLLHIDGNHSEELVLKDVKLYFPKIKIGGHIIFDDTDWCENGVCTTKKAYDILLNNCKIVLEENFLPQGTEPPEGVSICDKTVCTIFRK